MAAVRNNPLLLAAGAIAWAATGSAPAHQPNGHGRPADPKTQTAKPAPSPAGHLEACAKVPRAGNAAPIATTDASVAEFARLLHGTWVRRLTIGGAPVETNSFWYFDMSRPETGQGEALMIDRVNQGWDDLAPVTGPVPSGKEAAHAAGAELEAPATTGAYWSVSIRPAPADPAGKGRSGLTLALGGDYRGTGPEYPAEGLRFIETGTFYRNGGAYSTLKPWRAPPLAGGTNAAESFTPVDSVVATAATNGTARPTLTFVVCQDDIVDRYYKISSDKPAVEGKSLKAAWDSAVASGMFRAAPAQ